MEKPLFTGCECSNWCRTEQHDIRDVHHNLCPKYAEVDLKEILVFKVTYEGSSYCDVETEGLFSLIDEMAPGDKYTISREYMRERHFKDLPEFMGF